MQAPFGVLAGPCRDASAMRDLVRFYFGFSVPVDTAETSEAAVARVAASGQDIAVVATDAEGRWWDGLAGARAPKVFAKLPFIEIPDRPADLPAYVIGPPLKESLDPDIRLIAVKDAPGLDDAVRAFGGAVAARAGKDLLVELPVSVSFTDVVGDGGTALRAKEIGGFCQPIRFLANRVA
jgi:hypothetical protein